MENQEFVQEEVAVQGQEGTDSSVWERHFAKLGRQLLWTRICSIITSLLLICVLVGGAYVFRYVQQMEQELAGYVVQMNGYMQELQPAAEQLARLDIASLNETLGKVNVTLTQVDWEQLSSQISELDVVALNEAIEGLDTEALTEALDNLNATAEKLRKVGDNISSFTSKLNIFSKEN